MTLDGMRILIVDDNPNMRRLITTILQSAGSGEIRHAASAEEAIEVLDGWVPNLMLVDYVMEGEDGASFTRAVRASFGEAEPRLPIVIVTGHADVARFDAAKEAGANDFIAKPFNPKTLLQRIGRVLQDNLTIKELETQARQRREALAQQD